MSVQSINNACPSAQLDPAFPTKRRSYIPNRPPPPPPIRIVDIDCGTNIFIAPPTPEEPSKGSPTMEEKTEELLTLLANAALTTTSLAAPSGPSRLSCISNLVVPTTVTPHSCDFIVPTPTVIRPLPRFVPADISELSDPEAGSPASADFFVADSDELDLGALELEWMPDSDDDESLPSTPRSTDSRSLYSQASMSRVAALNELSLDAIPLEPATPAGSFLFIGNDDDEFLGMAIPDSPSVRPHDDMFFPVQSEKVLRSRWSSSTLAESFADHRSSGWRGRFIFGASKKPQSPTKTGFILKSPTMPSFNISKPTFATPTKKGTPSAPSPAVSASPTKRSGAPNTPRSSPAKSSRGSPVRTLARRDSNASLCSSDSGESVCSASSSTSNGLRRKPIPIEIFMRA
ncbi:uncharacterized protein PHACADRAFT_253455 [Phanerochaete carnosa HHB-10118-sp]|uniref:Uncharacterized protein n=1 Tax=Phanerochaete carnosa (strain HHB-10118-sp) TaxID=650164 RepID=K5WBN1_PHACS|nr:uncharacterized protein PHACADRAFT_253455 [Phanerochaete carnosa HHB-10118-sp]EKM56374.1 hypothetical protein PHACADRAFT_253455 [Phanerochaete carnosa HHB-10118-sp]